MKRMVAWSVLCLMLISGVHAEEEGHYFTDAQGRAIEAIITACEYSKNRVTLERTEDRRRVTVPINAFSKDDQAYIKEWYMAHELITEGNLKIICKEKTLDKKKEEKTVDVNDWSTGAIIGS